MNKQLQQQQNFHEVEITSGFIMKLIKLTQENIRLGKETMTKEEEIQQQIYEIESQYPNLHIDLHRDQFKSGDVDKLHLLYNQLEEVKKYGDVNQGLGTWNGYEYVGNK